VFGKETTENIENPESKKTKHYSYNFISNQEPDKAKKYF